MDIKYKYGYTKYGYVKYTWDHSNTNTYHN